MPDNNDIRTNVTDAWDSFHNSHVAYLQALIFVSRAGVATESDGALLQSYLDLGRNTATFGMMRIPAKSITKSGRSRSVSPVMPITESARSDAGW